MNVSGGKDFMSEGIDIAKIASVLGELAVLKFFPSDDGARAAILRIVVEMIGADPTVSPEDQVEWLVKRMTNGLYNEWPGPREFRACFCSRFKPRDGITAYSGVYADGIPSERSELAALPPAAQKKLRELPAGEVSADPEMDDMVKRAANAMRMR
jgi:hypothetical protein